MKAKTYECRTGEIEAIRIPALYNDDFDAFAKKHKLTTRAYSKTPDELFVTMPRGEVAGTGQWIVVEDGKISIRNGQDFHSIFKLKAETK